jgi:alginate O-acetyltransferase complex protein AlgI
VRYGDIAGQIRERVVTSAGFADGVRRFIIGLAKKVLVANSVAVTADAIFALPADELNFSLSWLGITCYTLQIYFDFSGYSDMARRATPWPNRRISTFNDLPAAE